MSRSEQSRAARRGRAFALILAATLAGACGDDDKSDGEDSGVADDGGPKKDAGNDAGRDAGMDGGRDAGQDAGQDAGKDASVDAGPVAMAGEDAPTLTKLGYFNDELGPRILIAGSDKNGDIATFTIEFFDMAGNPAVVNIDNDDKTQDTTYTGAILHDPQYADFFARFSPSMELTDVVKKIKVTVKDNGSRTSAPMEATLMMAPNAGATCDPNGFNRCAGSSLCAPNTNGAYSCQGLSTARATACSSSSILTLNGAGSVSGTLNSVSFWDMPMGCVGGGGAITGFADRIVKLHLDNPATKVTLSTGMLGAQGGPTFDAVIYKLDMCSTNPTMCVDSSCACGEYSLVLNNVAAGDYYIVVDSYPLAESTGNTFTLTSTVE
ncbi:MAG TPA: hypothetical protein VI299_19430 [Polyangiales bacterium]